ncbi:E3 ubiquitin ligase PQT3-like [Linum grandiflorum]
MVDNAPQEQSGFAGADLSASKYNEENEWDEFGTDLYAIPEVAPVISNNPPPEAPPASKADEDSKIKALIDTPALDWQRQGGDGFGMGRGFGRGMGGRGMGGRGFGGMGMERKNPPQGYVCHRCKVPGHFIQHCPTNGDPNYDIKRVKPPTGIPKSMLMQTPDGSYALPSGAVAVLRPNEAAFEKEIEGLPTSSSRPVGDLPPELHCPLCKEVMKDASLTSKCCFNSFCDKCIRDYIISKSRCVCGATSVLADDLLPNKTLRDTINRILESGNSSADNAGSTFQVQDMESARCPQPKFPSPTQSAASKEEPRLLPSVEESTKPKVEPPTIEEKHVPTQQPAVEKPITSKVPDVSEATHDSMSMKEPASQGSAPLMDEEVQQKLAQADAAKKKKKKKVRVPPNADMWKGPQDLAAENFMMPMGMPPAPYNPYMMPGMQPGMDPFMGPFGGPMPPFMGYGMGPLDMPPFGGMMPPDPFGGQGYMMPPMLPPQRDLAELGMGMNGGPPAMSRDQFEAWKAEVRRRRENDRRAESHREFPREREFGREVSSSGTNGGPPSMKSNFQPQSAGDPHHYRQRPERPSPDRSSRDLDRPPLKRKSDHHDHVSSREARDHKEHREHRERSRDRDRDRDHENDHRHHRKRSESSSKSTTSDAAAAAAAAEAAERKRKASVFTRISYPEGEADAAASKKRKPSSSSAVEAAASTTGKSSSSVNGYYDKKRKSSSSIAIAAAENESSDEDRHFKRKPSRYEPSPPPAAEWEEDAKHSSRSSRDRKHR